MSELFLAKILINGVPNLIVTNGTHYSIFDGNFSGFLALRANEIISNNLENELSGDTRFLNLIEGQHIFATGCTFKWSPEQIEFTHDADVYKKLYLSEQSMFFYKGNKHNLAENFSKIGIRENSKITIPEAELVAVFNKFGEIIGYTLGNDVTALDLERENPLYQSMAKFYKGSVSMLPLIKLSSKFPSTTLKCEVVREGKVIVETSYESTGFNRNPNQIIEQLMKSNLTENGGFLFLGCGVPYPSEFGLISGDLVTIKSDLFPIYLQNTCIKI